MGDFGVNTSEAAASLSTPHPDPQMPGASPRGGRAFEAVKRVIDVVLASILVVLTLPLLLLAALAVLVLDGRPVLFRQTRVGRHGRLFTMYKFRTMVPGAEHQLIDLRDRNERHGPLFKLTHDPRVTRVGRLLRESSIDELPQLFNVLRGSMSLVGPRPALPDETESFHPELLLRHQVRPGITGLWQVHSRDDSSFEHYHRLDLQYVRERSLRLDVLILLKTVPTVVLRAYDRLAVPRPELRVAPAPVAEIAPPALDIVEPLSAAQGL